MAPRPVCAICQPHYLPWMGYFEMIDRVDVFVFLDDVQFIKREWKNRNRIRKAARSPETMWLTVPIRKDTQRSRLDEAMPAGHGDWHSGHVRSLEHVYSHSPGYGDVADELFEAMRPRPGDSLADINIRTVTRICGMLGVATRLERSSGLDAPGTKGDKLLALCRKLGCAAYLANDRTGDYLDVEGFEAAGVAVEFQGYSHPTYGQWHRGKALPFLSHLSVVDLLCNHGRDALDIIRSGRPGRAG